MSKMCDLLEFLQEEPTLIEKESGDVVKYEKLLLQFDANDNRWNFHILQDGEWFEIINDGAHVLIR